jgi:hypothetical protein
MIDEYGTMAYSPAMVMQGDHFTQWSSHRHDPQSRGIRPDWASLGLDLEGQACLIEMMCLLYKPNGSISG